jgi:hypothetical protein
MYNNMDYKTDYKKPENYEDRIKEFALQNSGNFCIVEQFSNGKDKKRVNPLNGC